jgi:uncharacterized protein (UPF0333 family)
MNKMLCALTTLVVLLIVGLGIYFLINMNRNGGNTEKTGTTTTQTELKVDIYDSGANK